MTCPHCEELREEIRALKRQIEAGSAVSQVEQLATTFGVRPGAAQILAALYNANGRVLSRAHLDEVSPAMFVKPDERDLKIIDVRICQLRKVLAPAAIENVWGRGYFLTEIGLQQVKEALEGQKEMAA